MASGYKVLLRIDKQPAFDWPNAAPAPLVGDEVSGMFEGQLYKANVVTRHWNFDPAEADTAVLVVIAETPVPETRGRASVEPLRI